MIVVALFAQAARNDVRCAVEGGRGWILTQVPNKTNTQQGTAMPPPCDASPPSTINTDLNKCGVVGAPTKGFNDLNDVWVGWQVGALACSCHKHVHFTSYTSPRATTLFDFSASDVFHFLVT